MIQNFPELTIIDDDGKKVFPLRMEQAFIGRGDCNIIINDSEASRRHARILKTGFDYEIEDLQSSNGIFINDQRVHCAKLTDGDRILMGRTLIFFNYPGQNKKKERKNDTVLLSEKDNYTLDTTTNDIFKYEGPDTNIDAIRRAHDDLETVYRVQDALKSILAPRELFGRVLGIILSEFARIDCCSIHLLNEQGNLHCVNSDSRPGCRRESSQLFSESVIKCVLEERKAVLFFDARNDDRLGKAESIMELSVRSAMCVPLQSGENILGVIQALALTPANQFTREDLRLLTAIGMSVGAYVENAMLYEKLEAEKRGLEATHNKLKKTQEQLVQSAKLAAVGQLAAGIVHDIKNPLQVISGHASLIQMLVEKMEVREVDGISLLEELQEIKKGIAHGKKILDQLLQFSRQSEPEMSPVDMFDTISETLAFLKHELATRAIKVAHNIPENLPPVMADANQLKQTFINIIINAAQAIDEKGRIELSVEVDSGDEQSWLIVKIKDSGPGMSEEVKERIFDPFFTTKKENGGVGGSGLGLSVSYGIIQNHGGSITIESEIDKGSMFIIKLPLSSRKKPHLDLEKTAISKPIPER